MFKWIQVSTITVWNFKFIHEYLCNVRSTDKENLVYISENKLLNVNSYNFQIL